MTRDRIEEIKKNGYPLSFEIVFDDATRIFKGVALPTGVAFLLFGILYAIVVSLLAQNNIDTSRLSQNGNFADMVREIQLQMENQPLQQKITDAIVRLITGVLMVPMIAGGVGIARDFDTGKDASMGGMFRYFKGHSFSDLFVSALLLNLATIGIATAAEYLLEFSVGITVLLLLFNLCLSVLSLMIIPLIIFSGLGPIDAIRDSFAIVYQKFGTVFLLMIVVSILCMLGLLGCCIGVFFTLPLYCTFIYGLYKHSIGFGETVESEHVG